MAKKKKEEKIESIVEEKASVEEAGNIIIDENGEKRQRPDPVVPQEDAVAPDAPIYESIK